MPRHGLRLILVAAVAVVGLAPVASADTVQYWSNQPTSPQLWSTVPESGLVVAALAPGTDVLLETDLGDISCTSGTARGRVTDNPGSPTDPDRFNDDVEGEVESIALGGCTENSAFFSLVNCTGAAGPVVVDTGTANAWADADTNPPTFGFDGFTATVCIDPVLGANASCAFTGGIAGDISGSTVAFSGAPMTSASGFPCPAEGNLTALLVLGHDHDNNALTAAYNVRLVN